MGYSLSEEKEFNKELKIWQVKLAKCIKSEKWDTVAEQLTSLEIDQITIIMRANSYKNVNWIVWNNADHLVETVRLMTNKPKCFNRNLRKNICYGEFKKDKHELKSKCTECKYYIQ